MEKRKEILTTPGLITKVAKELGMPESDVRKHVGFLGHWVETLAEKEGVCQIQIPHVGHLYPNVRRSFSVANNLTRLEEKGHVLTDHQQKIRTNLITKAEYIRSKYPSMERYSLHGAKLRFGNWYFRKKMGTAELQKFQNEQNITNS